MKTFATTKLTHAYLQKLDRQNYVATAFAVLVATCSLFWMLFHIGGDAVVPLFADLIYGIAASIGAVFTLITAYRAWRGPLQLAPRHQLAWLLVSVGLLADSIGGFYFAYLEQAGQPNPTPSAGDIGFTLFYLCVFFGLLSMPTAMRFRIRTALDALITTLCMLGISWFFFIGPSYMLLKHSGISSATFIVSLSYPFWDMLLIFAIVMLIRRRAEKVLHPSLLICGLGILSLIWADTTYAYFTANGTYNSGTPAIDTFWFIGSMLVGLSALYQYKAIVSRAFNEREHPTQSSTETEYLPTDQSDSSHRFFSLQSGLIYFPVLVLFALVVYQEVTVNDAVALFMTILTALVGLLVTIRYLLATHENDVLLKEREQSRQDAEHLRHLGTALTSLLELQALYEQIVHIAAAKLTFDASMLILIDEQLQPVPVDREKCPSVSLQICTANALSIETQALRLAEEPFVQYEPLLEGEKFIVWTDSTLMLSPKIYQWHTEHKILSTLFIPLLYQGKVLGSLGFASESKQQLSQRDTILARAYAEEVAIAALANAQLYEQQRTAHRRLQELDQLKDQFMVTASHELRTPLTAVQGYIELIAQYDEMLPPEQRKEFLQKARRSCDELVVLLGNVMDASRLEMEASIRPASMELVNVRRMIESVTDLIEPQLKQQHRQLYLTIPEHLVVQADAARLRQVLVNISVNAIKYSPSETPIAFSARIVRIDTQSVVILSIADKGKGIAPQDQGRLFERFVRLESDINSSVRGSGLGLYISRRLIEAMDGKIWLESRGIPGEGSTFHIQLPATSD